MVLPDIFKRPLRIIKIPARANPEIFYKVNLHVVDIFLVPNGGKNPVSRAQNPYALHQFLSKVVVNSVNLLLIKDLCQGIVKFARAFLVRAKWLFKNNAAPAFLGFCKAVFLDVICNSLEMGWQCGKVKKPVAFCVVLLFSLRNKFSKFYKMPVRLVKIEGKIVNALRELAPCLLIDFWDVFFHFFNKRFARVFLSARAHNEKVIPKALHFEK